MWGAIVLVLFAIFYGVFQIVCNVFRFLRFTCLLIVFGVYRCIVFLLLLFYAFCTLVIWLFAKLFVILLYYAVLVWFVATLSFADFVLLFLYYILYSTVFLHNPLLYFPRLIISFVLLFYVLFSQVIVIKQSIPFKIQVLYYCLALKGRVCHVCLLFYHPDNKSCLSTVRWASRPTILRVCRLVSRFGVAIFANWRVKDRAWRPISRVIVGVTPLNRKRTNRSRSQVPSAFSFPFSTQPFSFLFFSSFFSDDGVVSWARRGNNSRRRDVSSVNVKNVTVYNICYKHWNKIWII